MSISQEETCAECLFHELYLPEDGIFPIYHYDPLFDERGLATCSECELMVCMDHGTRLNGCIVCDDCAATR